MLECFIFNKTCMCGANWTDGPFFRLTPRKHCTCRPWMEPRIGCTCSKQAYWKKALSMLPSPVLIVCSTRLLPFITMSRTPRLVYISWLFCAKLHTTFVCSLCMCAGLCFQQLKLIMIQQLHRTLVLYTYACVYCLAGWVTWPSSQWNTRCSPFLQESLYQESHHHVINGWCYLQWEAKNSWCSSWWDLVFKCRDLWKESGNMLFSVDRTPVVFHTWCGKILVDLHIWCAKSR